MKFATVVFMSFINEEDSGWTKRNSRKREKNRALLITNCLPLPKVHKNNLGY